MVLSQFCTDEAVNSILNYSKTLIDTMNAGKNPPRELKEIQYLIFAGMISYYGFEDVESIHKAFRSSNFIYTKDNFETVIKRLDSLDDRVKHLMEIGSISAFVSYKIGSDIFNRIHVGRDIYVMDEPRESADVFLEKVIHEVNHVVNSVNNTVCLRKGKRALRNGLFIMGIDEDSNFGELMEESYNVLQSAEIMEHILEFTQYDIQDPDIKRALDRISYAYGKKRTGVGYEITVPVFRELYNNPHFNFIVKKHRMNGLIKEIRLDVENKLGEGQYGALCDELDKMHYNSSVGFACYQHENKVREYVKKYTV